MLLNCRLEIWEKFCDCRAQGTCVGAGKGWLERPSRKNLRHLNGYPLIQWSISIALECEEIDAVVVSTDDEQIGAVATAAGAEVPFNRPSNLAADTASTIDVVFHALDFLESKERHFDIILLLEPTSPLREVSDVKAALQSMIDKSATAIVSVCRAEATHPTFMFHATGQGRLRPFMSVSPTGVRRQDIEALYYIEGTLYASTVRGLRETKSFYHDDTLAYEVDKWKALEIDDYEDFELAEAIARYKELPRWTIKPD